MTDGAPATVMIVDDTPENLRVLAGALNSRGYRVRAFPSGELALRAAAAEVPDMVLLDINMPGMDGFEVCDRLKADPALQDVPVLFISAMQDTEPKLEAFQRGGLDYITKPFRLEEVFARVDTHLELCRLRRDLKEQNARLAEVVVSEQELSQQLERESQGRVESQQYFIEHMARVAGLTELSDLCSKHDTESGLLEAFAQVARRVTGGPYVELVLLDDSRSRYHRILLHEKDGLADSAWGGAETVPWSLEVLEQGVRIVDDSAADETPWARHLKEQGLGSGMAMPVMAGSTTVGVLTTGARFSAHFDKPTQNIIREFASTIGANLGLLRALQGLESNLDRADAVLVSVLPPAVSRRLKSGESKIADRVPVAGIFFCDLAGFTAYSSTTEPEEVVGMLEGTFALLEEACRTHHVEKIKTIGDAFMVVSGISIPVDDPVEAIARFALAAAEVLDAHLSDLDIGLGFRIGIHAGPVLAGVLGSDRLSFDVWGDTVNFASRLESSGAQGEVRCSDQIRAGLGETWRFRDCGLIPMKGKGEQQTWVLLGRDGDDASGEGGQELL